MVQRNDAVVGAESGHTDSDYEAALERLREYRERVTVADREADRDSLARAADLRMVYGRKRWLEEMPAPKRTHFRGRPIVADSVSRFAQWVTSHPERAGGYRRSHVYRFLDASEVARIIVPGGDVCLLPTTSEYALRPLVKLLKEKRADEIPAVWDRALRLAEGGGIDNLTVKRALNEHEIAAGRRGRTRRQQTRIATRRASKDLILREFQQLIREGQRETAYEALEEQAALYKAAEVEAGG